MKIQKSISMDDSVIAEIKNEARKIGLTFSAYLEQLCREDLKKKAKK